MRRTCFVILALLTALPLADAAAQQAPSARGSEPEASRQPVGAPSDVLLSSTVIGARVKNREGKDLGEVDQLLIEPKTGQVTHAVLGLGGLAGVGETKVVVDWTEIQFSADPSLPRRTIASVDQAAVERAPRWNVDESGARERTPAASPPTSPTPRPRAPRD